MSPRPAKFRQVDVTRALRAAKASGLEITRVEIDAEGKIVVVAGPPREPVKQPSGLDRWLAKQAEKNSRALHSDAYRSAGKYNSNP
jgi:hypothetical protein